jgi:hypothetical protein
MFINIDDKEEYMWFVEDHFKVIIGGATFIDVPIIVEYGSESLFTLRRRENDGQLGISFDIYGRTKKRIATIRNNQIVEGNEKDYEFIRELNRYAVIEQSTSRIICDIRKRSSSPQAELLVSTIMYLPNGFLFQATPERTNINNLVMSGVIIQGGRCAIHISS